MFTIAVTSSSDARDDEHEKDGRVVLFPNDMFANAIVASSDEDEDEDKEEEEEEDEDKEEEEGEENEGIFSSSEGDADEASFSLLKFILRQVSKTVDLLRKDG
ncbi:hypothetical protein IV203_029231 [Nitzschia inconspicua]|uniref:Uncharacterized protein n=1 Tax=Nitzschia inconspicua TaxID=303405 RepID=A0A9K3LT39_9STRA|nr:hypothetical protein IV203_029231 [Nitzschia inconspicua]